MNDDVTPFPTPLPTPFLPEAHHADEISRRQAIAAGLRRVAGFAGMAAFPVLGAPALLGGCQSGGRWKPLPDDDPSLNGPIMQAPFTQSQATQADTSLTRPPAGVIPRRQWTSERTIAAEANAMVRVLKITVHHDGMPPVTLRQRRSTPSSG